MKFSGKKSIYGIQWNWIFDIRMLSIPLFLVKWMKVENTCHLNLWHLQNSARPLQNFLKTFIEYCKRFKVKNTLVRFDFEVFTESGEKWISSTFNLKRNRYHSKNHQINSWKMRPYIEPMVILENYYNFGGFRKF